ncbi:hypothetical protein, partial [Citrobacter freundii]|uniref:hypothetical protein n=1 Tax=Citrobacter freundii TaxID=546 RepID=UPI001495C718
CHRFPDSFIQLPGFPFCTVTQTTFVTGRQQVRDQMQRTEREWVVNVPEKEIELEKTLGGD